jgi:nucleotide-binding universal stress UspA family protein
MTIPYRSILNPIDLEDPSLFALAMAKQLAAEHGATLHLLYVVPRFRAIGEPEIVEDEHSVGEQRARARLQEIAAQQLAEVEHQIHTVGASEQVVAKAVIRVATKVNADLIVLKTQGRKGLERLVLGSVAEEVVRAAPCAVLTLSPEAERKIVDPTSQQSAA